MLTSLGIRNYRNLKSLDIERLARVNLIAGKNNTGKTSLLEAVSLYAAGGGLQWINTLLEQRGELYQGEDTLKNNIRSYQSLFYEREIDFNKTINIGPINTQLKKRLIIFFSRSAKETSLALDFGELDVNDEDAFIQDINLEIKFHNNVHRYSLSEESSKSIMFRDIISQSRRNRKAKPISMQFVSTSGNVEKRSSDLWDIASLEDKESHVIDALKIVERKIEKIVFIAAKREDGERKPMVKLNDSYPIPLMSLGDGMGRIFNVILALVNASDGYLLIDEFENGLHYTVQEDLWKMIFALAKELNVQVFATTHSDDCIQAFENVLNSEGNQEQGLYFRLDNINGQIMPTFYSPSELNTATEQIIEMR